MSIDALRAATRTLLLATGAEAPVANDEWDGDARRPERVPFHTTHTLANIDLNRFLIVESKVSVGLFAETYEAFLAGYWYSKKLHDLEPTAWLRRRLQMDRDTARRAFLGDYTGTSRKVILRRVGELALLAAASYMSEVEDTDREFVVTHPEFQFGVSMFRPISNVEPLPRFAKHHYTGPHIYQLAARWTVPGPALAWADKRSREFGKQFKALRTALLIQNWYGRPAQAWDKVVDLQAVLLQAREYRRSNDPVRFLYSLLVPDPLTSAAFQRYFTNPVSHRPKKLSLKMQAKFDRALEGLSQLLEKTDD